MSARVPDETRARILADLAARERFTMKAIGRRHGVSRATLWRLRDELRDPRRLKRFASDIDLITE
ncbi:MAG: helix-turn-helix domain-containing protein [Steroidobacteraceae bacterium]